MLVADVNALEAVDTLDLLQQIVLDCADALDLEQIVRVDTAFRQLIAGFDAHAVDDLDTGTVRDRIFL